MPTSRKTWIRIFIGFFIIIFGLTILSRIIDSALIPKVQIQKPLPGKLSYAVNGSGMIEANAFTYVKLPEGLRVDKKAEAGTSVKADDAVVWLNMEDLEKQKKAKETEAKKLELQIRQQELTAKPDAQITEEERSQGTLAMTRERKDEAQAKLNQASADYDAALAAKAQERDEAKAAALEKLNQAAPEEAQQAKQDYDATIANLDADYENFKSQKQAELDAARQNLDACNQTLREAEQAMELARKSDAAAASNQKKSAEAAKLGRQMLELDLEQIREEIEKLESYIAAGGAVKAGTDGAVFRNEVVCGSILSGAEILSIGTEGFRYRGTVEKDSMKHLAVGMEIQIYPDGEEQAIKAKITELSSGDTGTDGSSQQTGSGAQEDTAKDLGYFYAELPESEYSIGMSASYKAKLDSKENYDCLVPISALRQDNEGDYCLILETKSTILGEEDVVKRAPVEVLEMDGTKAALANSLNPTDRIVSGSSKNLDVGDRVRVIE